MRKQRRKPVDGTRMFDGQRYSFHGISWTRVEAERQASDLRRDGMRVRITNMKPGYGTWFREPKK